MIRLWFAKKMIKLCDFCLTFSEAAENQNEINEVIEMRNYFIRKRDKLSLRIK